MRINQVRGIYHIREQLEVRLVRQSDLLGRKILPWKAMEANMKVVLIHFGYSLYYRKEGTAFFSNEAFEMFAALGVTEDQATEKLHYHRNDDLVVEVVEKLGRGIFAFDGSQCEIAKVEVRVIPNNSYFHIHECGESAVPCESEPLTEVLFYSQAPIYESE